MLAVDIDLKPLVQEAREGNAEAWDQLFRRYQLPLYSYVFECVRQEQPSLDIVQETFINAARHLHSLRDDARFGSWLFGIAHQKCAALWRKEQRQRRLREHIPLPTDDPTTASDDPGALLIRQEQEQQFLQLLEQLPDPHRSVLLLHYLEEFSLEDIAAITDTPLGTVKSRLHYAKKMIRQQLQP